MYTRTTNMLLLLCLFALPFSSIAADTLTVERCRELALQQSPVQQKKSYAESILALQQRNIKSASLPRVQLGAQASWQSDVFNFPIENPLFNVPEVPKDQYKITLDVNERIWDGGSDRVNREQKALERDVQLAQIAVDAFSVKETVTDLYFKALLLQENIALLESAKKDLEARLKQAEAAIAEGAALKTSADQVRIQILKTEQQISGAKADIQTMKMVLQVWTGLPDNNFILVRPAAIFTDVALFSAYAWENRPEFALFVAQEKNLLHTKEAIKLRSQPRIEAFVQAGLGRPNPFNFFETGFQPFTILGLRAVWTPVDWGNSKRDARILDLQAMNIATQRNILGQRLEATALRELRENIKYSSTLAPQDDAMISLQEDIVRRADAQVRNGVMTMTDYLTQVNLLTQARLNKQLHEIQALQAVEMWKSKL